MDTKNQMILLISYLVDFNNKLSCDFDELLNSQIFKTKFEIEEFIKNEAYNFFLIKKYDNKNYLYMIPIPLCPFQTAKTNCTDKSCRRLHLINICTYYLYGECQFKDKCNKTHNVNRLYNENIIKYRQLTSINHFTLAKLLKLFNTYKITFCRGGRNCSLADCDSLHCCFHKFINDKCDNSDSSCEFGHLIDDNLTHNMNVLKKRNLDNVSILDLQVYFKQAYNGFKDINIDKQSVNNNFMNFNNASNLQSNYQYSPKLNKAIQNFSNLNISSNNNNTHHHHHHHHQQQQQQHHHPHTKKPFICEFNLSKKCKYGDNCQYYHTDAQYIWQYLEKDFDNWYNFDDDLNRKIERAYCNPKNKKYPISLLDEDFEINFDTMKISDDCLKINEIRRITKLDTNKNLKWLWYYQVDNDKWNVYASNEDIENAYKNYLDNKALKQFSLNSTNTIIFDKMIENYVNQDNKLVTRKMRRRPELLIQFENNKPENNKFNREIELPEFWQLDPLNPHNKSEINIDLKSNEFRYVFDKLRNFLYKSKFTIMNLFRLQNYSLLEKYHLKETQMSIKNNGNVNEIYAFHKLNVDLNKLEEIFENNLGIEYTIRNSSVHTLGNGIYFMIDPSKCDYMFDKKGGALFLVKILTGYWTKKCDPNANLPPQRISNIRYDSIIDQNENIICIFDRNQIMPLYLIFYK